MGSNKKTKNQLLQYLHSNGKTKKTKEAVKKMLAQKPITISPVTENGEVEKEDARKAAGKVQRPLRVRPLHAEDDRIHVDLDWTKLNMSIE